MYYKNENKTGIMSLMMDGKDDANHISTPSTNSKRMQHTHTKQCVWDIFLIHTRNRGKAEGRFAEEVVQTDTSSHNTNIPRATFPITRELQQLVLGKVALLCVGR